MKRIVLYFLRSMTELKPLWRARLSESCAPHGSRKRHHACKSGGFNPCGVHSLSTIETCDGHPLMLRLARSNTASGFETGWLKNGAKLSLLNFHAICDALRARSNGFGWLPVFLSRPKAPNLSHRNDDSSNRIPATGFCLQPT